MTKEELEQIKSAQEQDRCELIKLLALIAIVKMINNE